MYTVYVAVLIALVAMADASDSKEKRIFDLENAQPLFEQFMKEHNKVYKDDADKEKHYRAFQSNLGKINELNKNNPSATFGINKFADYTEEERKSMFGFKKSD